MSVIGWLIFVSFSNGQTSITICPSKLIYHIPCPGCGLTRATICFHRGDIEEALLYNPNVFFVVAFIYMVPVFFIYDFIKKKEILYLVYVKINRKLERPIFLFMLFIFELIIWINNILCYV